MPNKQDAPGAAGAKYFGTFTATAGAENRTCYFLRPGPNGCLPGRSFSDMIV
jgi:hypothetical protein